MTTLYYDAKPSLVVRKLKLRKPDPNKDELQTLLKNEHFEVVYDPDKGIVFELNVDTLDRSLVEVKHTLKEAKLPINLEDDSLLEVRQWAFFSGKDQEVLEAHGFRRDVEDENRWTLVAN